MPKKKEKFKKTFSLDVILYVVVFYCKTDNIDDWAELAWAAIESAAWFKIACFVKAAVSRAKSVSINLAPAAAMLADVAAAAPWNALSAVKSAARFPRPFATLANKVSAVPSAPSALLIVFIAAIVTSGPTFEVLAVRWEPAIATFLPPHQEHYQQLRHWI